MGSTAAVFALVAVAIALICLFLGHQWGRSTVKAQVEEALENERRFADAREFALRQQLDEKITEIAALKPRAEELTRVQEQLKHEQAKYDQMKGDLDVAFKGAAAEALRNNTESFLALARQELLGQAQEANRSLEAKEKAIHTLLQPLEVTLKQLDEQTRALEVVRAGAYGEIRSLVENIGKDIPESLKSLKNETAQLVTALRTPKTRGNWGELQLRRCVEYAGMVQYCSFAEQTSARDDDNNLLRPDMMIQMPNGRTIIVDAKTPIDAFLESNENLDPTVQALRLAAHAERVKTHLRELSSKAYWKQFDYTPEFVVCFLPSEALFSAALEADPSLIEFGTQSNVMMATPTTLIALLRAVAFGWQQSQITQNAKTIQETGRDLYSKLVNAHEYFEKLGSALGNAVGNFNKMVGAIEGRGGAFFQARKLGALVNDQEEIEPVDPQLADPRPLAAEDWPPSGDFALAAEADHKI
jgi:DNA recombination protein RmuC